MECVFIWYVYLVTIANKYWNENILQLCLNTSTFEHFNKSCVSRTTSRNLEMRKRIVENWKWKMNPFKLTFNRQIVTIHFLIFFFFFSEIFFSGKYLIANNSLWILTKKLFENNKHQFSSFLEHKKCLTYRLYFSTWEISFSRINWTNLWNVRNVRKEREVNETN